MVWRRSSHTSHDEKNRRLPVALPEKILGLAPTFIDRRNTNRQCPINVLTLYPRTRKTTKKISLVFTARPNYLGMRLEPLRMTLQDKYLLNQIPETEWTMVNGVVVVPSKTGCIFQRKPLMKCT